MRCRIGWPDCPGWGTGCGRCSRNGAGIPRRCAARSPHWMEARTGEILDILGDVGRNAGKLALALFTVFFLYRDGESLRRAGQAGIAALPRPARRRLHCRGRDHDQGGGVGAGGDRAGAGRAGRSRLLVGRTGCAGAAWRGNRDGRHAAFRRTVRVGIDRHLAAGQRRTDRRASACCCGGRWW